MPEAIIQEMSDLAQQLAREAAKLSLGSVGQAASAQKPDGSVVTEVDHAIQAHILEAIARAYPDHAVCAEETLEEPGAHADRLAARFCWVVDPLDGTRNYVTGFPCFATSIAVLDRGQPVVAAVSEHNLGHLYAACSGGEATLNGKPIHAEPQPQGEDLLIGIPSSKDRLTIDVVHQFTKTRGLICRNLGSTALHLAMVASSALAATFCKQAKIWDIAAGALLVTETGGRFTDPFGQQRLPFDLAADPNQDLPVLAAEPQTHQRLLDSIRAAGR